ncbi:MAG: class I tRNA ligase family protein [Magnetococcales bacterium]|nr:class I tRNA ligase family protein [Magnetococcales bacterium]
MYKKVDKSLDFVAIEKKFLKFWQENRIFSKLKKKNATGSIWSFQDGPITANNPMGVHHAWGRSLKDIFQRYHAMLGDQLRYQNGFDCQGLWVEVEIEKEHAFKSKKDILEFGMDRFVRACKERVLTFAAKQTEQSIRLGYWMDWDDPDQLRRLQKALHDQQPEVTYTTASGKTITAPPEQIIANLGSPDYGGSYFTFSDENNYTIWGFLKKCHTEGHIYRGTDVMTWCPRCGTGLSQMEVAEGRRITEHTSVYVRFPLRERDKEAFLVWTTTPWTLTSNVAVAINPDMTYLKIRHGGWIYYVGKENFTHKRRQDLEAEGQKRTANLPSLAQILSGLGGAADVLAELPGTDLLGLTYNGPCDELPAQQTPGGVTPFGPTPGVAASASTCHRAIPWKEISGTEGTGIVHIAPGCGTEDYHLGKEHGLAIVAPLDDNGIFLEPFGPYAGQNVLTIAQTMVNDLKSKGILIAREQYPHVYPHCWRCKTELIFRLIDGWYIDMRWRDQIKKVVPEIRWIPADGEARELDWLHNMGDWLISKKRFWGLALPIWECHACNWFTVIGGAEELKTRAVAGWEAFAGHSPHRPYIDQVKITCEQCGQLASRVDDVGNPWLDAGIVPFSTVRYNSDRPYWQDHFPADMVIECFPGQFRNWFYSLLAMSVKLEGRAPFKTLLGHALVRDEQGKEMHKSAGNAIFFDDAADILGADVMRYLYAGQNPGTNLNFPRLDHKDNKTVHPDAEVRRKLLTFWNCYSFFVSYAQVDQWSPGPEDPPPAARPQPDRWILSRLQLLIQQAHDAYRDAAVHRFMEHFERFVDELSNWYLRRSRRRFWGDGVSADKRAGYATLHTTLITCVDLLAPILPFLTEEIYQNLLRSVDPTAPESVHLRSFPQARTELRDALLEQQMESVLKVKNMVLALRNEGRIKTKQPLGRIRVLPSDPQEEAVLRDPSLVGQILDECNIKNLVILDNAEGIQVKVRPNYRTLGAKAEKQMQQVAARIAAADAAQLQQTVAGGKSWLLELDDGRELEITALDLQFSWDAGPDQLAGRDKGTLVVLETGITPELAAEGMARNFNRLAQNLRRDTGLEITDRIRILFDGPESLVQAIQIHHTLLCQELLAQEITHQPGLQTGAALKLESTSLRIALEKLA